MTKVRICRCGHDEIWHYDKGCYGVKQGTFNARCLCNGFKYSKDKTEAKIVEFMELNGLPDFL